MILLIFIIAIILMATLFFLGATQQSFGLIYLAMFVMLLLGLFIMSDGIDIENGIQESPIGSHNFITVYETHTTQNDFAINVIANTFFYLPLAGILLSTFFALRGR